MYFAVTCIDKPDGQELRRATRDAHIAYLKENAASFPLGGPFLDESGESITGSLMILEVEDRAACDALLAKDPYGKAGLFQSVEVRRWSWFMGAPEKG